MPPALDPEDATFLTAFNARFGTDIADVTVVRRLLSSPHVREWYADYRATRAQALALPAHWRDAGLTAQQWAQAEAARQQVRAHRAAFAREAAQISAEFQQRLRIAEANLATRVDAVASPLTRVLDAGYEQLPLDAQIRIESQTGAARDTLLKAELAAARRTWVAALQRGENPF